MHLAIFLASILEHIFSQLLQEAIHALQASMQALYFSFTSVEFVFAKSIFNIGFVVAAIVMKQIAAMKRINFFIF